MWILLSIFVTALATYFMFHYNKDKDKRKLMFAIAFWSGGFTYIFLAAGFHNIESEPLILSNLYQWSSLPAAVTLVFALTTTLLKIKNFDLLFKIYLVSIVFMVILIFLPFSIADISSHARQLLGSIVIIISGYLLVKTRDIANLMFLLSMICFTVAGVSLVQNMEYFSIFSNFMAYTFLTMIFAVTPLLEEKKESSTASYFSLRNKLQDAEKALHESEKRYRIIVENSADVIMLTRNDGIISYLSPSCKRVLGYDAEDLVGKQPWIIHPDDIEKVKTAHHQSLDGKSGSNFEYRIKTKNGETRWVSHSWSPVLKDGKFEMVVSLVRDVTDRKKMEEEIKKKIKSLEENELATLNIMEDFQEAATANEKANQEIEKKNKELQANAESLAAMNTELAGLNKELRATQEKLFVLNKGLERKVQERTADVEKLLKQKDEFIWQLGHDLKTPLTPLNVFIPMLKEDEKDPNKIEMLDGCIHSVNRMKSLVFKTLELARLNSPTVKLDIEDVNLSSELDGIIKGSQVIFDENSIEIKNMVDEEIIVKADKVRLGELFDNLLSNAAKYTPEDGGTITVDAKKDKNSIIVSVKDTGIGMTKEQIDHAFEEFYKADDARHDLLSHGLGLSICKNIVEKHGGKIWVESPGLDKGTTMFFTLPLGYR